MGRIRQLDPATVEKIAAGEVIERPASVVKELVENSIDAGATRISVCCRGGGFDLIEVVDDGSGMEPEDARLAFRRHSTSKLARAEDLFAIRTLGFRGEALPSIAAVARVEMVTCPAPGRPGRRLLLEGGTLVKDEQIGAPPGTRVTVWGVLSGLPARRKFLSEPRREGLRVVDAVIRLAVCFPEIAFRLEVDGRSVLSTPGGGRLLDTLVEVYGTEVAHSLLPLRAENKEEGICVTGYLGRPATARTRRDGQLVSVNRRVVRAPALVQVVEAACGSLLPSGKHPFLILYLEVPPATVDVNVHPTKAEVRLAAEGKVKSLLARAVTETLRSADLAPALTPSATGNPDAVPGLHAVTRLGEEQPTWGGAARLSPSEVAAALEVYRPQEEGPAVPPMPADAGRGPEGQVPLEELVVMGQWLGTYLLAAGPDALYVVDQHAAHERVFYENTELPAPAQFLLLPLVVEVGARDRERLSRLGAEVSEAGFTVETWAEGAVVVRAVPAWAVGREEESLRRLLDRLEDSAGSGLGADAEERLRRATAACQAAVKASSPLNAEEGVSLLRQLASCRQPWTCPHGRPTLLKLERVALERYFRRR